MRLDLKNFDETFISEYLAAFYQVVREQGSLPSKDFPVAMAWGSHPFPFRTRKLSPTAPMVLPPRRGGRVGRRRDYIKSLLSNQGAFFVA